MDDLTAQDPEEEPSVVTADLNADGTPDLALTNADDDTQAEAVTVVGEDGTVETLVDVDNTGTYETKATDLTGDGTPDNVVRDLNADNVPDVEQLDTNQDGVLDQVILPDGTTVQFDESGLVTGVESEPQPSPSNQDEPEPAQTPVQVPPTTSDEDATAPRPTPAPVEVLSDPTPDEVVEAAPSEIPVPAPTGDAILDAVQQADYSQYRNAEDVWRQIRPGSPLPRTADGQLYTPDRIYIELVQYTDDPKLQEQLQQWAESYSEAVRVWAQ